MSGLTTTALRAAGGETSYERGVDYVQYVVGLRVEGRTAHATIQAKRVYAVELAWNSRDIEGTCTCPHFAQGFFCKHLVALGLAVVEQLEAGSRAESVVTSSPVEGWLSSLDADALRDVVRSLATHLDVARVLETRAVAATGDTAELSRVMLDQTIEALRTSGFIDYRRSFTVAAKAQEALDTLAAAVENGAAAAAQPALKHAVTRLRAITLKADDSGGTIGEACQRAADLYTRACREGGTDGVALAKWVARFRLDSPGWPDIVLADVVDAFGAKGLAAYRKAVASAEAAIPARAERWSRFELDRMLLELADHDGDVDAAIAILTRDEHTRYGGVIDRLDAAGRHAEALLWVDRAVAAGRVQAGPGGSDYWLDPVAVADRFVEAGRPEDGLALLRDELARKPSVAGYRALLSLAERLGLLAEQAEWAFAMLRERAARTPFEQGAVLVELALADGDADAAWAAADEFGPGFAWRSLVERTSSTHPSGCARLLRASIDDDLRLPNTKKYPGIAAKLARVAALRDAAGESEAAAADLADLRETYRKRTSFIAALDRAGL